MRGWIASLLATMVWAAAGTAAALTIDIFEDGEFSIATGSTSSSSLSGLDGVLGGERLASVGLGPSGTSASASLTTTPGDDDVEFGSAQGGGFLILSYGDPFGGGPVDLTGGGSQNAFSVDLGQATAAATATFTIEDTAALFLKSTDVLGPGELVVPFADFAGTPDFTQITRISLRIQTSEAGNYRIDDLLTVPEPSTGALLAAGLLFLRAWPAAPARGRQRPA